MIETAKLRLAFREGTIYSFFSMSKSPLIQMQVQIEKFSSKGYGIGQASKEGSSTLHKVEVPHTVPGDTVLVEIGRKRKGAYFGFRPQVIAPSQDRVKPRCAHAEICGGCSWQQVSYEKQREQKQQHIEKLFCDIKDPTTTIHPIISCETPWLYRNKMEYTFSENKAGEKFLGLIMTGGKGRVFSLTECQLTEPWFHQTVNAVREFWQDLAVKAYNLRSDEGSLRTLTLRKGIRSGHKMAFLTVSGHPDYALKKSDVEGFIKALYSVVPDEEKSSYSIFLRVQQILKGSPTQFYEMHLAGPDYLSEELFIEPLGKKYVFKISPTAFFQPNTLQAERLYARALEMAGSEKLAHVLDLYAGTSTLGILFSKKADKVTSIEINPHAVFDAEVNKEWNQITNLEVKKGDVAEVLAELRKDPSFQPELVVVDPPRSGLDPKALDHLLQVNPKKIIYISCNPSTQADNVKYLVAHGYRLRQVQPVDQFPHTIHVENLCLLQRCEN